MASRDAVNQRARTLQLSIRDMRRNDLLALEGVLAQTGLFPVDLLRSMAEPWLSGQSDHHWLTARDRQTPIGFAFAEPERMTEGTFNLLAIAVLPSKQSRGAGKALVTSLMQRLRDNGGRILLVETSSLDAYARTRSFYTEQAFTREARIRDFYQDGEDKIVYWMNL
jgi:ribosomal protein S18 acetylase RimI-like enzyme